MIGILGGHTRATRPLPLFRCSECGSLQTPLNGVQGGTCGTRRGLGVPPARVCEGRMEFIGTVELTPAPHARGGTR